ncbi:proline dehydrogenase 2, mitochondrial [Daucus carota subsp. sativus]|uniref:Proline dehydrogenase n=1 Tax=Daucus carota subsp. sativus TaxID=79200 RepID=A0A166EKM5_DAUCS|nr:PREDICTED: proline dehydrogenase 2, mitochondrial-like [Daucus carota subsp. sativus]
MAFRRISSLPASKQAVRSIHSRVLRPDASSSSASAVSSVDIPGKQQDPNTKVLVPSCTVVENGRGLFASKSSAKLLKSFLTLEMAASEPFVDLGTWIYSSRLMKSPLFRQMVFGVTKVTFFDHFVAGTNNQEAGETVKMLWNEGIKGMLDYGLEHAFDNASCDKNMEAFIETIESTKSLPPSSVSSVVAKVTAICPIDLLRRMSDLLRWEYKERSYNLPWKMNTLPLLSESSPLYHTLQKPEPLSLQEERDLELAYNRLQKIIQKCHDANVPLVIDAEETWIQPAIDYFTYSASIMHTTVDSPLIYGTIQAYLKDAHERLVLAKKAADKMRLPMGVKLVRGAYMSAESQVAASLGYESPIHNSIRHTHRCYNDCASFMLDELAKGPGSLVLATHNCESGKLAATKAIDSGMGKDAQKLQFAQLYGMSEIMSYELKKEGFQVSKYLPFGPVEQIMPYLVRRAEENKGVLSTSSLDRELMKQELQRRLRAAFLRR